MVTAIEDEAQRIESLEAGGKRKRAPKEKVLKRKRRKKFAGNIPPMKRSSWKEGSQT